MLRSQVGCGDASANHARADWLLLHPAIGQMLDETVLSREHHSVWDWDQTTMKTSMTKKILLLPRANIAKLRTTDFGHVLLRMLVCRARRQ